MIVSDRQKMEGIAELLILTVTFYLVWRFAYGRDDFPAYYGRGKFALMGIYFVVMSLLFYYDDRFKFGHLKLTDVLLSQWISAFIVNVITYFQLSLIANRMINSGWPHDKYNWFASNCRLSWSLKVTDLIFCHYGRPWSEDSPCSHAEIVVAVLESGVTTIDALNDGHRSHFYAYDSGKIKEYENLF